MYVNKKPRELKADEFYNLNEVIESELLLNFAARPHKSTQTAAAILKGLGIKSTYSPEYKRQVWKIPGKVIIEWNERIKANK